jgi:hypothetical protein
MSSEIKELYQILKLRFNDNQICKKGGVDPKTLKHYVELGINFEDQRSLSIYFKLVSELNSVEFIDLFFTK